MNLAATVALRTDNVNATIVQRGKKHCVVSETGKNLGCSPSRGGAERRLKQVEYFKHLKGEALQFSDVLQQHGWKRGKVAWVHKEHPGHTIKLTADAAYHRTQGDWEKECHEHGLDSEMMTKLSGPRQLDKYLGQFAKGKVDRPVQAGGPGSGRHPGYANPNSPMLSKVKTIANKYGMKYQHSFKYKGMGGQPDREEHVFSGPHTMLHYHDDHSWVHKGAGIGKTVGAGHGLQQLDKHLKENLVFNERTGRPMVKPAIAAGGPGSGRHKYAVGDRVKRTPKVKQWKVQPRPGVVVSQEKIMDNNGRMKLGYRILHDDDKKNLNHPDPWQRTSPKGTSYLEEELVPEKHTIKAGGPGSGCNPAAGQCGRHPGPKQDPLTGFKNPKTAGRATKRAQKKAIKEAKEKGYKAPRVDKSLKTKQLPSGQKQETFEAQEKVILKEDIYRGSKRSKAGEEAIVVNVLPKVANQPQIYSVRLRNGHTEYLTHDQLARPVVKGPQEQKPALKPLEGSKVKQSWVAHDGSRFTEFFPSTKGMDEGKTGPRDPFKVPHSLKGTFERTMDDVYVKGAAENRITSIYSAQSKSGVEGAGTTVFVHRYPTENRVTVQEVRTGQYNWQSSLLRQYHFEGRQAQTKAMTFTKARYGISLKLPKMRF